MSDSFQVPELVGTRNRLPRIFGASAAIDDFARWDGSGKKVAPVRLNGQAPRNLVSNEKTVYFIRIIFFAAVCEPAITR